MVLIDNVMPDSPADKAGIKRGDYLLRINGNDINDVLDYRYYLSEKHVSLLIHRGPEIFDVKITKSRYDDIGLEFSTFLMDEKKSCRNKCVFCFIDQLPDGMRESLYFKDDDSRLSFLMGNYITMTNMSDEEVDRIVKMKMSPMNISVHTTNPELRVKMLSNKNAGKILDNMKKFHDAGIEMHCQIVLCKGLNDGKELERSMTDLEALYPEVSSVSIVPAGLTCHRQGLYPIEPFSKEDCREIIDTVTAFADRCKKEHGCRLFYLADELYIKAEMPIPPEDDYDGYPQIENGVGMIRSMYEEFEDALHGVVAYDVYKRRNVSIATGEAAYGFISSLARKLADKCPGLTLNVYKIKNNFFGENITVSGLLTGIDVYKQLRGKKLGDVLILPSNMLKRDEDLFLDGMTPDMLSEKLHTKIIFSEASGDDFIMKVLNYENA